MVGDGLVRVVGGVQQPVDGLDLVLRRDPVGQVQRPLPVQLRDRGRGWLGSRGLTRHLGILVYRVLQALGRLAVEEKRFKNTNKIGELAQTSEMGEKKTSS